MREQEQLEHVQNKLLADAQRHGMEIAPCGHSKKYETFGVPGPIGCVLCDLLRAESELSSLRAEVERLRTTVTALRGDHNHETCAHNLTYWYRFHGDCCMGCGENLHLLHPLTNLYPHFTGACRAALSEARKETCEEN